LKQFINRCWIVVFIFLLHFSSVWAQEPLEIHAKSVLLLEAESGEILFQKNTEHGLPPASITKLMTYLVAMDALQEGKATMEDQVKISPQAANQKGANYQLKSGEEVRLGELVAAMMIVSANDAAWAIAEHIGGDAAHFVTMMNQKSDALGLDGTYFINPNGMPEKGIENRMTAKDIGELARYLLKHHKQDLLALTDRECYENVERNFKKENTNGLLKVIPAVDGLKTGYTDKAGYCLVSTMNVEGKKEDEADFRLIAVVLGTESNQKRVEESQKLLRYGQTNYVKKRVVKAGEKVSQIYFCDIKSLPIGLVAKEDMWVFGPKEGLVNSKKMNVLPQNSFSILKGQKLGTLMITLSNKKNRTIDLLSDREIKETFLSMVLKKIWSMVIDFLEVSV
jgi:D-alanyl-D-alanine carboxypeptidase (penicillin-binding protein 5/6)